MTTTFDTEIKVYNNLVKQHDFALNKFSSFFKAMTTNGIKFIESSKKSLEEFFTELKKENSSATHIISLTNLYNGLNKYFDKMNEMFHNIDEQCVNKIIEFSNNFKSKNTEIISDLTKLDTSLKEKKSNIEKCKNEYFNSCKIVAEQEVKIHQLKESKNKKEEELKKYNELYEKNNITSREKREKYLLVINKYNNDSGRMEKNYFLARDKIYVEQENRIKFIYEIINNFKKEIINFGESNVEVVNLIEKLNKSMNIERDVDLFKDEYNFCNEKNKRLLYEEFLDYEVLKTNLNEEKDKKNSGNKKDNKYNFGKMFGFGKKDDGQNKINEQKIKELIQKLFNEEGKLDDSQTTFLMNYLENEDNKNKNNQFKFIQMLIDDYNSSEFIKINNEYNFNFLASYLQLIIDSHSNNIQQLHEQYFFIIKFSENVLYNDKENIGTKNYLCTKISILPIFSKKEFWVELMNSRIKMVTEEKIKSEMERKEKGKNFRGNITEKSSNYMNKFKGMFGYGNENKTNKKVEDKIVFGQMYNDCLPLYCIEVIEEYIQHFSNFNLSKKKSKIIIKEMLDKYKFDKIYYEYFIAEINSNTYSKKNMQIDIIKNKNKNKIKEEYKFIILNEENSDDLKLNLLIYAINNLDLDLDDYFNILKLNKTYYNTLKKVFYRKILLKYPNIEIAKKIKIWKIILDCDLNKTKYNYQEIKNKIKENPSNQKGRDVIDLDIVRTSFIQDKESNQEKIKYILKSVVEAVPGLSYNQGMNYVAAFLLNINNLIKEENSEEESFYLLLGLFTSTKYGDLFKDNLAQLKKSYYIFERLISIFIPELFIYFMNNNIKVSYFISSWFITLFTNAYQHTKLNCEPKILTKILDLFFVDGWKSIFVTSIFLLKSYESKIMIFSSEDLLHFLISDIIKEKYFENENFDKFLHISYNCKIDDELIERIEKEFDIKSKNPNLFNSLNFQII